MGKRSSLNVKNLQEIRNKGCQVNILDIIGDKSKILKTMMTTGLHQVKGEVLQLERLLLVKQCNLSKPEITGIENSLIVRRCHQANLHPYLVFLINSTKVQELFCAMKLI